MQATVRLDDAAHLTGLQCESCILERRLHDSLRESPEVAILVGRAAIRLRLRQLLQGYFATPDPSLMLLDDVHRFSLGTCDLSLFPAAGSTGLVVLDEKVVRPDLSRLEAAVSCRASRFIDARTDVLRGHILFELIGVGSGRGNPVRDLFDGIEVVRKVLGIGVANLPVGGKTGSHVFELGSGRLFGRDRVTCPGRDNNS
jgi:hypothetical protein